MMHRRLSRLKPVLDSSHRGLLSTCFDFVSLGVWAVQANLIYANRIGDIFQFVLANIHIAQINSRLDFFVHLAANAGQFC